MFDKSSININIGIGEAVDRLSILEIKCNRLHSGRDRVEKDRELLAKKAAKFFKNYRGLEELYTKLLKINSELWDVEDRLRELEKGFYKGNLLPEQAEEFIILARSVYKLNDERYRVKVQIDNFVGSEFREEKSYVKA